MSEQNITLYFQNGSSDKVYKASIEQVGDGGYLVNFAYGRTGSTLRAGTKTQAPVDAEKAQKIYDKLIKAKMSKGYMPEDAQESEYVSDFTERDTGFRPQLLNPCSKQDLLTTISDEQWCLQEKFDGERRSIHITVDEVVSINRKGLSVGGAKTVISSVSGVAPDTLLDGEAVGDMFHVFDILEYAGKCLRQTPYVKRMAILDEIEFGSHVSVVSTAWVKTEKQALYNDSKAANAEGVVAKLVHSLYKANRPSSGGDHLKFKFYKTASVVVASINDKRSINMIVKDNGDNVAVGACSIPANHKIPQVSDVVEIRYLYAYKGGSLYQPTYIGKRTDIDRDECVIEQLEYKRAS